MIKRLFDMVVSALVLIVFSPVLIPVCLIVYFQDFHSPFYIAPRVGKGKTSFKMVKLRSMIMNADKKGGASTSASDRRITPVGHFIRRYKLDEITQMWNVLLGDMSLVGPRPNVKSEVDLYTKEEDHLLDVKPGITDFASIVFSDEGDILKGKPDADIAYHQLIRPYKSQLGLFYIQNRSFIIDFKLVFYTAIAVLDRRSALNKVNQLLVFCGADSELVRIAKREEELQPAPPPGAQAIVTSLS